MRKQAVVFFVIAWSCAGGSWAGAPSDPSQSLTLPQAIDLAIQNNLATRLAQASGEQSRGQVLQAAAALLPRLTASLQQSRVYKVNLESQGFPASGSFLNPLIGPFNSFDARLHLAQSVLDIGALWKAKAGRASRQAARLQEQLAREQVAAAAALAFLEAQRAERAVSAAQADEKLAQSLFQLAKDQKQAGVAAGIDVARAETAAARENLRLIRAKVAAHQADVRLKRVVGLPLDRALTLPEISPAAPEALPALEKALAIAGVERAELQIAEEHLMADAYALRSARAENYPSLLAAADYGYSGTTPENAARTGRIGGRLDLPVFSGGAAQGRLIEAEARQRQSQDHRADVRVQIEEDVRLALQTLQAGMEEIKTADLSLSLANQELAMARDRFAAGVGDNLQLLSAQTSLARALDDQIEALARYHAARLNLAAALGQARRFQ